MPRRTNRRRRANEPAEAVAAATVRVAGPADLDVVASLAGALWPEHPISEHRVHMRAVMAGAPSSALPLTLFVAEREGRIVGFLEVGLRSHADGCDPRRPAGYVEGWFVTPEWRGQGVGRLLMVAAEEWAISRGSTEMASDTWIDNESSQRAHEALGFEIVDRCINFKKTLRTQRSTAIASQEEGVSTRTGSPTARQGQFLAFIHHYTKLHGRPPAEADMVRYFEVSPPSVHTMVKTLERRGFIGREPGKARFHPAAGSHRGCPGTEVGGNIRELGVLIRHHGSASDVCGNDAMTEVTS